MGCIIIGIVMLLLIVVSIILMRGKGTWLIGYNTLGKKEKEEYDSASLCKFIGKYLLSISLLMPILPIGGIFRINWLIAVYVAYILISTVFVVVYCNTGNHFKKSYRKYKGGNGK